jgi:glycosyltransferase involved in cell wall biosynthesis
MPFFSIVIPVYNVENYIKRAINSIINQKYQNFELIIVDDCSDDNTLKIITAYERKYKNIIVIKHLENRTQHIARMNGVDAAKGKYILFLDGDDYFTKNAFSILYKKIEKNPGYDFYEFGYIRKPSCYIEFPSFSGKDRFLTYFAKYKIPVHTMWNKVYENNILKKAFLHMEKVSINECGEDLYESIVIAYFSRKTMNINKIIINYTIGSGISTTYKDYNKTIMYLNALKIRNNLIEKFLKNNNQFINMDNLYYRSLESAILCINKQKNNDEKSKLYLMILDYFDGRTVLMYLNNIENSVLKSKDYIVGHILLQPLRKLKISLKYIIYVIRKLLNKD